MKKTICLLLALLFTFMFTTAVFAVDEDINNPLLPLSPDTVTEDQYGEIEEEFEQDEIPQAPPVIEIMEEQIPEALPQTGGIPAEAFYIVGGIFIISALLLLSRKSKTSSK